MLAMRSWCAEHGIFCCKAVFLCPRHLLPPCSLCQESIRLVRGGNGGSTLHPVVEGTHSRLASTSIHTRCMPKRSLRRRVSWLVARACLQLRLEASVLATAQKTAQIVLHAPAARRRGARRLASAVVWHCAKRCETPRRAQDVLRCVIRAHRRLCEPEQAHVAADVEEGDVAQLAEDERAVLVATAFRVARCDAHACVLALLQALGTRVELAQRSWNAAHDAMRTPKGATCADEAVACAAVAVSMDEIHLVDPARGSTGWFQDVLQDDEEHVQQAMDAYRALKALYRKSNAVQRRPEGTVREPNEGLDRDTAVERDANANAGGPAHRRGKEATNASEGRRARCRKEQGDAAARLQRQNPKQRNETVAPDHTQHTKRSTDALEVRAKPMQTPDP